jgi:hypothetical protein
MFDKKQIETLAPYESYFESATIANYVRNIPADKIATIKEIWEKASGEKVKEKLTCGACLLNFMKRVGQNYYKDKRLINQKKNAKKKKEPEQLNEQS